METLRLRDDLHLSEPIPNVRGYHYSDTRVPCHQHNLTKSMKEYNIM